MPVKHVLTTRVVDDVGCGRMATGAYGRLRARGATERKTVPDSEKPGGRGAGSVWGRVTVVAETGASGGCAGCSGCASCNAGKTSKETGGCGSERN